MPFPSTLSSFPRPAASDRLNSPSHSALHNTVSSALGQVEAVIGVEGPSSVVGTIQYLVKSPASDGGGHVQTANRGGTGQTSYTKGDILVAQSSSVISKLAAGSDGQGLRADSSSPTGVSWGSTNTQPSLRVYANASVLTWTKPSFLSYVVVTAQGAGSSGTGTTGSENGEAGGNGGGYARVTIPASLLGTSVRVQVGGSVVGTTGAGSSNYTGFGTFVSILGSSSSIFSYDSGIAVSGQAGGSGFDTPAGVDFVIGGPGGSSRLGSGGQAVYQSDGGTTNGTPGTGYGGGGGGGAANSGTDALGGNSSQGIVIVEEY